MSWPFIPPVQPPAAASTDYGPHFKEPWKLLPRVGAAANIGVYSTVPAFVDSTAAGFFTIELAARGINDDTNWTANTYKTILSVTGKGLVAAVVGCTSTSASMTTTVEFTVDGVLTEIAIPVGAGERGTLMITQGSGTLYTTANIYQARIGSLNAAKTALTAPTTACSIGTWEYLSQVGTPMLEFYTSLLIRMKHTENITGTAAQERQSAIMYRVGL